MRKDNKMSENSKKQSVDDLHKNHRMRMRKKFLKDKAILEEHELIEMLLYYSIPRMNTNNQARELLMRGKTLSGILELNEKELRLIPNLGENTITLIKLLHELSVRTQKQKYKKNTQRIVTSRNITDKLKSYFIGEREEMMVMLSVDNDCRVINSHVIAKGNECSCTVPIKQVVENAILDNASFVFFAHNHPHGILVPSDGDLAVTKRLCEALSYVDVMVIEHYIFNETSSVGIMGTFNS